MNDYVVDLINTVDDYGKKWYSKDKMKPPEKISTPYGGRLTWTLPNKSKIVCHLKDKEKIRHKKRWSQIMYMYYFLGYQIADRADLTEDQKEYRARRTFCLALDGDVDFQPKAVQKAVDMMQKNPEIGAACGRIHPTGSRVYHFTLIPPF